MSELYDSVSTTSAQLNSLGEKVEVHGAYLKVLNDHHWYCSSFWSFHVCSSFKFENEVPVSSITNLAVGLERGR